MRALQVKLLGQFECSLGSDERISLSTRKAEVLLASLALTPGIRHPRERLINLLWSDRSEEQARNSLRQALSALKKALGESGDLILQIDRNTVSLKAQLIEVDAHEFERLASTGDYESLCTAADLYLGDFLEGISIRDAVCQDWIDNERDRFKRQYIEILKNLAETQLISHDFSHAVKSAERLVKQDSLHESGWRLLMKAYHGNGERNRALQAFKRCEDVLRYELDIEPEPATVEIRDQISTGSSKPAAESAVAKPLSRKAISQAAEAEHSIAVLPFDNLSGDPEQEYFSDGITESIILNLSLFPDLKVKSRNSSFAYKQHLKSLGEISKELAVDYLVEGSIRKSSERIRITVQLIDATNGDHIWGKRYDAQIDDLIDLEEELSRSIAATVTGQIESDLQRIALAKNASDQQAYDLLLGGIYHMHRANKDGFETAIKLLDRCLELDPGNVRAHATLYNCHIMFWMDRLVEDFGPSFELAGEHARKALELGPDNVAALFANGDHQIFCRNYHRAGDYIDKALSINPYDPDNLTAKVMNLSMQGRFEEALETAQAVVNLDPYSWWISWNLAEAQYLCGQYEAALETIKHSNNAPNFIRIYSTASHVKLGQMDEARSALKLYLQECRNTMAVMPQTLEEWLRYTCDTAPYQDSSINQDILDCLVKAGLEESLVSKTPNLTPSSETSILVLPFSNLSGDSEQEYLSDGITESIILSLGSFSGLNVKSSHTSKAFKNSPKSISEIAAELDVKYVVEGSIRRFGNNIRITVQLDETKSGDQLWGKRYDAEYEKLYELEEDLVRTVAGTISGRIGKDLRRASLRKPPNDMQSHDHLMRGLFHFEKNTPEDNAIARQHIQKCLENDPDNAEAHAYLGMTHVADIAGNWSKDRDVSRIDFARHLEKALELDPDNPIVHAFMAECCMSMRHFDRAVTHVAKAIELNPFSADGYMMKCYLLSSTRRYDEAVACVKTLIKIDPYDPLSGWYAGEALRAAGEFSRAIEAFRSLPHISSNVQGQIAACLAGLGKLDEARKEMKVYLELARDQMPNYPENKRAWQSYWYDAMPYKYDEDSDTLFDLLLKAGLDEELEQWNDDMPSIAVLPFENLSDDAEQEYFADGITADLVQTLSKFDHLRTVTRYSTLPYKESKPSIAEIASQQRVRYILEGNVRRSGDRIRVSAELIDSSNENIIWSERFDSNLDDLFAVQDKLTIKIALAMKVQLDDGEMARVRSKGTSNVRAWELAMTAVDLMDTYIHKNILEARKLAEEATQLDPDYPYAWIALGWTHWQEAYIGGSASLSASIDAAEEANQRAYEIDPEYAEVLSQRGMIRMMRHDAEGAIEYCRQAVEREPGSAEIQGLMGLAYIFAGQYDNAEQYSRNMLNLSPIPAGWHYLDYGQIEMIQGNLEKAADLLYRGLAVEPDSTVCRFYLIDVKLQQGDETAARQLADEIRELDPSINARGVVHAYSIDPELRNGFQQRLSQFGLI